MAGTMCLLMTALMWEVAGASRLQVLHVWSQVDLVFPPDQPRHTFITSGQFIPDNNILIDIDVWKDRLFVTMPQFKKGVPVTLATVSNQPLNTSRLLRPYPDWSWHRGDCDGLTSVFRTHVDRCGRLWVVDSGRVEILTQFIQKCPPQILVFDLNTDKLIRRHRFPDSVLAGTNTLMVSIKVDVTSADCSTATAYIADCMGHQLFVYDLAKDKSWRVSNYLFYPYPLQGHFHINGVDFVLMDGIMGLALGPVSDSGDRTLYFHSLASVRQSWVSTEVIANSSMFEADPRAAWDAFHVSRAEWSSQSTAHDTTETGVLLHTLVADNAIGCWDTRLPFSDDNLDIVAKDDVTLQFQSGLKIYGDKVWTLSNRFQNFQADQVRTNEINMRVNVGRVSDLVRNTKCDARKRRKELP